MGVSEFIRAVNKYGSGMFYHKEEVFVCLGSDGYYHVTINSKQNKIYKLSKAGLTQFLQNVREE